LHVSSAITLLGILGVLIAMVFAAMAIFGFGLFQRGTADFRGKTKQIEQTKASGTYRIAAYEHFYDLCAAVQDDEISISSLREELKTEPPQNRVTQINASLTALRSSRGEKINQYNADARKSGTIGQFKASDLPYQLNKNTEETTCTA
jgi:hypothetical protein